MTIRRAILTLCAAALPALALAGCADENPVAPQLQPEPKVPAALGVMEITITGIGTPEMSASAAAIVPGRALPSGASFDLLPVEGIGEDESGIELQNISTGSFTEYDDDGGGVRYVWATYRVRNATSRSSSGGGTAYDAARQNLTFLAVDDAGTLGQTAISTLRRFDGSKADNAIAATILPTGAVHRDPATRAIVSSGPDVLQVLTEDEVDEIDLTNHPGVATVFPFGFVVRNPDDAASRTLAADPAPDQFDGIVTFAFKVPLQASTTDDPFMISFRALAVEDTETRITQSLEEQTMEGQTAVETRAADLAASRVTLLAGGGYNGVIPSRMICSVRTAGSAGSPAAFLVQAASSLEALSPDPYSAAGSAISRNARITAHFDGPVTGADAGSFIVRGLQSGRHFVGDAYAGNGTSVITTPAGSFFPGEEIEVVLTDPLAACSDGGLPHVARLRAAVEPGTAGFASSMTLAPGSYPQTAAIADLNGDGILDLVTMVEIVEFDPTYKTSREIHVVINDGDLSNPTVHTLSDFRYMKHIAIGDLTGDGIPDLAVATDGPHLLLYPGIGDGTFDDYTVLDIGGRTTNIALGDLNGDGNLDMVVAESSIDRVVVLLSNGDGTFAAADYYPTGMNPMTVVLADFNEDGALDFAVAIQGSIHDVGTHPVGVRLGDGRGGFGAETRYDAGRAPTGLVAADLNGDGRIDLAVANDNTAPSNQNGTISILLGNGDGTFGGRSTFTVSQETGSGYLAAGDVDGDGHIDLVSSFYNGRRVTVHLNDGTGSFSTGATPFADRPKNIALGDLNGDGRLDIAMPHGISSGSTHVIFND